MNVRSLCLCLTLTATACGGSETSPQPDASVAAESNCTDKLDNDGDGKTDCADSDCAQVAACKGTSTSCTAQFNCGDVIDEIVTKCCLDEKCVAPGETTASGDPVTSRPMFGMQIPVSTIRTVAVRFVHPKRTTGAALTCSDLKALGNCTHSETTRNRIDSESSINQVFRSMIPISITSGQTSASTLATKPIPYAPSLLLYAEWWTGARTTDANNPTGECLYSSCVEGTVIDASTEARGVRIVAVP